MLYIADLETCIDSHKSQGSWSPLQRERELDSMIMMGPFQLEILCHSMILSARLSAGILPRLFSSDGLQETICVAVWWAFQESKTSSRLDSDLLSMGSDMLESTLQSTWDPTCLSMPGRLIPYQVCPDKQPTGWLRSSLSERQPKREELNSSTACLCWGCSRDCSAWAILPYHKFRMNYCVREIRFRSFYCCYY